MWRVAGGTAGGERIHTPGTGCDDRLRILLVLDPVTDGWSRGAPPAPDPPATTTTGAEHEPLVRPRAGRGGVLLHRRAPVQLPDPSARRRRRRVGRAHRGRPAALGHPAARRIHHRTALRAGYPPQRRRR